MQQYHYEEENRYTEGEDSTDGAQQMREPHHDQQEFTGQDGALHPGWTARLGIKGTTGCASVAPSAFPTEFQKKPSADKLKRDWMSRLESMYSRNTWRHALTLAWRKFDMDDDKICSALEMLKLLTTTASIYPSEAEQMYKTWDPEMNGFVTLQTVLDDLSELDPTYEVSLVNAPPSAADVPSTIKSKSNRPSQPGGIFGGGAWSDEYDELATRARVPAREADLDPRGYMPQGGNFSNKSSIEGGIFGFDTSDAPKPPPAKKSSNTSSIPGGIFAMSDAPPPPPRFKKNSNTSSVPGGIFASAPEIKLRAVDRE